MQRNIKKYHESVNEEFTVLQNRFRNLATHAGEDGAHKEVVLRAALRSHLPETLRIGRGFVLSGTEEASAQIDVLITDGGTPTLFREGDTVIVTPDCVRAIIEVKTRLGNGADASAILTKLANDVELIRKAGNVRCTAGLFVYEDDGQRWLTVFSALAAAAQHQPNRVINHLALGPDKFFRFWPDGSAVESPGCPAPCWHAYSLPGLSYSYFVGNTTEAASCHGGSWPEAVQSLWYPEENGKESKCEGTLALV